MSAGAPPPAAIGEVLALLATADGRVLERSATRGQLYASAAEVVVLRPTAREALLDRVAVASLVGSLVLLALNLLRWRSLPVLWGAAALQAIFWVSRPARLRRREARPLDAAALEAARRAGRAAISVPAGAIVSLEPPAPRGEPRRRPARLVLPDGAVELWLDEAAFAEVRRALGRG